MPCAAKLWARYSAQQNLAGMHRWRQLQQKVLPRKTRDCMMPYLLETWLSSMSDITSYGAYTRLITEQGGGTSGT